MPVGAATARYVHYALNAPAWVIVRETPEMRWSPSTYWTGHDLRYFLVVIVLWFVVGVEVDRKITERNRSGEPIAKRWSHIFEGILLLLYGCFVCYRLIPDWSSTAIRAWTIAMLRLGTGWWFFTIGLVWAVGFISVGLYLLFSASFGRGRSPARN
jgi:hypothetical protein